MRDIILDTKNSIIYINFQIIDWLINEKITTILSDCSFPNNKCTNCEGYKLIHIEEGKMAGLTEDNFLLYKSYFDAVCSLYFYKKDNDLIYNKDDNIRKKVSVIEIYDVCVSQKSRNKGILNKMFESIIETAKEEFILWLGIDPYNPMWDTVLHTYTKFGFIDPYITYKNTQGADLPITVGFYRRYKPTDLEIEEARNKANELKKDLFKKSGMGGNKDLSMELELPKNSCTQKIFLSKNILEFLYGLLSKDVEYAGNLRTIIPQMAEADLKNVKDVDKRQVKQAYLGIYNENEKDLAKGEKMAVNYFPTSRITFHTHPSICYRDLQCYLGWPSATDMASIFQTYYTKGVVLHLLISEEGLYFINLNPWFQKASRHISKKCVLGITETVKNHFLYDKEVSEMNRSKPFPELQYDNYMRFVNNLTINDLINREIKIKSCKIIMRKPYIINQPVFQVQFVSWKDLEKHVNKQGGFHKVLNFYISNKDKYKNIGCGLPQETKYGNGNFIF